MDIKVTRQILSLQCNVKKNCSAALWGLIWAAFLFFGTASFVHAYSYYTGPTNQEISNLPKYLQVKVLWFLGERNPKIKTLRDRYWKVLGPGYTPTHHYALGWICLDRVRFSKYNMDPSKRKFNLESAVKEFDFVIQHGKGTGLKVMYEVWYKRGEALILLNRYPEAVQSFRNSIKLEKKFYAAYVKLSQCYLKLGLKKKAKDVLAQGRKMKNKNKAN